MKKTKILIALLMSLSILVGESINCHAESFSTEIQQKMPVSDSHITRSKIRINNKSKTIDSKTLYNLIKSCDAYICDADSDCDLISTLTIEDNNIANEHIATLTSELIGSPLSDSPKYVSKSKDKNTSSITATATLHIAWTDKLGTGNILNRVWGSLDVAKGRVVSGEVRYGDAYRSRILWTSQNVGAANSFSYSPQIKAVDPGADYTVKFAGSSSSLYISVSSSIFQ